MSRRTEARGGQSGFESCSPPDHPDVAAAREKGRSSWRRLPATNVVGSPLFRGQFLEISGTPKEPPPSATTEEKQS